MDYYLRLPASYFKIQQFVKFCSTNHDNDNSLIRSILQPPRIAKGVYVRSGTFCWAFDYFPEDIEEFTLKLVLPKVNIF